MSRTEFNAEDTAIKVIVEESFGSGVSFIHVGHKSGVWLTADETRTVIAALQATLPAEAPVETTKAVDLADVLAEVTAIKDLIAEAAKPVEHRINLPRPITVGDRVTGEGVYAAATFTGVVTHDLSNQRRARYRIECEDGDVRFIHAATARRA